MIAGEAIAPLEAYAGAWPDDEGAALLERVPAPGALSVSTHERGDALHDGPRIERFRPSSREPRRPEGAQGGIGEQRAVVSRHRAEGFDVLGLAAADHHERAGGSGFHRRAEASHLLAAEDSAEVADEGEDHGPLFPEGAEDDGSASLVEHGDPGESRGEVVAHPRHSN